MARRPWLGCRLFLAILILLLVLFPALEEMARPILLIAAVASVFVVGVVAVNPGPSRVKTAIMLASAQIVLTGAAVVLGANPLLYVRTVTLGLATTAVLIVYCIYCVLRYVLESYSITRDQIYAGICVYLMIGFAFGCIYYLVNILNPGCFALNNTRLADPRIPDLMYFSFVTLATLGYGDITPVTKAARALAQVEALAGMLYIAVFMARLVTLQSAGSGDPGVAASAEPSQKQAAGAWREGGRAL
jgi:hypothetical protein